MKKITELSVMKHIPIGQSNYDLLRFINSSVLYQCYSKWQYSEGEVVGM